MTRGLLASVVLAWLSSLSGCQPDVHLSFDLKSEYAQGVAAIETRESNPKSQWAARMGLVQRLVTAKASRADRLSMAEAFMRDGDSFPPEFLFPLISALADDGEQDTLVRLLARRFPTSAEFGPITIGLHMLRLEGVAPDGLSLAFKAYRAADPSGQRTIEEVLRAEFGHFVRHGVAPDNENFLSWCEAWYAANRHMLIPNFDTAVSGSEMPDTAAVLIPVRAALEDELLSGTWAFSPWSWITPPPTHVDRLQEAEQAHWSRRVRDNAPLEFSARIVGGDLFTTASVECDLEIRWRSGQVPRCARVPARFSADVAWLTYVGEQWATCVARPLGSPQVLCLPGEAAHAVRVAAIAQLLKGTVETSDRIKVYRTREELQVLTDPSLDPCTDAWSMPGGSLKIVADGSSSDQAIRDRLMRAKQMQLTVRPESAEDSSLPWWLGTN